MTGTAIPVYLHSGGSTEAVFRYSHQKEKSGNPIRVVNAVDSGELVKDALRVSREEKIKQMTVVDKAISELERTKVSLRSIDAMKGVMSAELDLTKQKEPAPEAISPMKILQDMVDKLNVQVAESLSVGGKVKPGYTFGSPCPPLTTAEKVIKKSRSVGMSTTLFTPKYLENQCLLTTAAEFPGQLGLRAHFPNQRSEDE
jgi:hypothetical protein